MGSITEFVVWVKSDLPPVLSERVLQSAITEVAECQTLSAGQGHPRLSLRPLEAPVTSSSSSSSFEGVQRDLLSQLCRSADVWLIERVARVVRVEGLVNPGHDVDMNSV